MMWKLKFRSNSHSFFYFHQAKYFLWFWITLFTTIVPSFVNGSFNLWISSDEVKNLLGLSKELYYVREGVLNSYALQFTVPVPPQVDSLHFIWQTLGPKPLPYTASIEISEQSLGMETPKLNISSKGLIPIEPQTFQLSFPCTRILSDEAYLELRLEITESSSSSSSAKGRNFPNSTTIILKRKRICLKDTSFKTATSKSSDHPLTTPLKNSQSKSSKNKKNNNNNNSNNNTNSIHPINNQITEVEEPVIMNDNSNLIYIVAGCGIGLILILVTLGSVAMLWIRTRKGLDVNSTESSGFLHVETNRSGNGSSSASSSGGGSLFLGPKASPLDQHSHHYSSLSPCIVDSEYSYTSFLPVNQKYAEQGTIYSEVPCYKTLNPNKLNDILTIPRCKVRLECIVMEGTFAKVYNGTVLQETGTETNVIVKTVNDHSSPVQMALLLHEGLSLVGMSHENVLSVIAVAAEDRVPPFLIYPDQGFSNLKRFLQRCKSGTGRPITVKEIVNMGIQIGNGLSFLHSQNLVHRDISTRNCVVDNKLVVKVSDSALSRDLFPDDYHWTGREPESRPVKWSSPEVILHNRTSIPADMWSFGVLLWELASRAQPPYAEIPVGELVSLLQMGYRLDQPSNCPDELYSCMTRCWTWDEDDRPKWNNVLPQLQDLHSQLAQYV